jgi:hypothetical protein
VEGCTRGGRQARFEGAERDECRAAGPGRLSLDGGSQGVGMGRQGSMAMAGRSRMDLEKLEPWAWLEACNRTVAAAAEDKEASARPTYSPKSPVPPGAVSGRSPRQATDRSRIQTIAQGTSPVVTKVGVAWEVKRDEGKRAVTTENSHGREWSARVLSLPAPRTALQAYRRRIADCPKATPR